MGSLYYTRLFEGCIHAVGLSGQVGRPCSAGCTCCAPLMHLTRCTDNTQSPFLLTHTNFNCTQGTCQTSVAACGTPAFCRRSGRPALGPHPAACGTSTCAARHSRVAAAMQAAQRQPEKRASAGAAAGLLRKRGVVGGAGLTTCMSWARVT